MKEFIVTIVMLCVLEGFLRIWHAFNGTTTADSPASRAISTILTLAIAGWGIWLLA